jgi:hypothetical protein
VPPDLAAIRERDAVLPARLSPPRFRHSALQAEHDRRALLAHIDALAEAVEELPGVGADTPYWVSRAAVLAIIRGERTGG